jgi:exodeoxyribonuclease-3
MTTSIIPPIVNVSIIPEVPKKTVKILSLNVNSLRTLPNRLGQTLDAWLKVQDADIVCFQETKLSLITQALPVTGYDAYYSLCQTKKGYSGVATYVRKGFPCVAVQENFGMEGAPNEGRVLCSDHESFVLYNVYVPNPGLSGEKVQKTIDFYTNLLHLHRELTKLGRQVIVIGDINIANYEIDTHNPKSKTAFYPEARKVLSQLINYDTFVDTYRYLHPKSQEFTCFYTRGGYRKLEVGWRIDYALISNNMLNRLVSSVVSPLSVSDHAPIILTIMNEITTQLVIEE